jgi:hypothetical protein
MKKFLVLIFSFFILFFSQPIQFTNASNTDEVLTKGYSKFFCEKRDNLDNCKVEIYYDNSDVGQIKFLVKSEDQTINNYKIYLYDIFGREIFEKDIKYPSIFTKKDIVKGLYYLKVSNGIIVFNKRIVIN